MRVKSSRHPEEPAAEAAHLITRLAIALLLIVAPIASVGTRRAIYVLVPIGVALTLVAWLLEPGGRGPRQLRDALFSSTGLLVIFLGLFAALSLIWTPFGQGPSERYVKSASTFVLAAAAAALLPERTKTSNLYLLPIGVAAGAIAVVAIALFAPGIAGRPNDPQVSLIARSAFGIALLVWPALGALRIRRKTRAAIALAAATVIAELAARVPLALVATAIGALVFAAALSRPNVAGRWTALVGAALFFVAPVAALFAYLVFPFGIGGGVVLPLQTWGSFIVTDGLRFLLGHGFDSAELGVIANYLPSSTPARRYSRPGSSSASSAPARLPCSGRRSRAAPAAPRRFSRPSCSAACPRPMCYARSGWASRRSGGSRCWRWPASPSPFCITASRARSGPASGGFQRANEGLRVSATVGARPSGAAAGPRRAPQPATRGRPTRSPRLRWSARRNSRARPRARRFGILPRGATKIPPARARCGGRARGPCPPR